jgi:hypothetical protein
MVLGRIDKADDLRKMIGQKFLFAVAINGDVVSRHKTYLAASYANARSYGVVVSLEKKLAEIEKEGIRV